jgi:hypothetical protein
MRSDDDAFSTAPPVRTLASAIAPRRIARRALKERLQHLETLLAALPTDREAPRAYQLERNVPPRPNRAA